MKNRNKGTLIYMKTAFKQHQTLLVKSINYISNCYKSASSALMSGQKSLCISAFKIFRGPRPASHVPRFLSHTSATHTPSHHPSSPHVHPVARPTSHRERSGTEGLEEGRGFLGHDRSTSAEQSAGELCTARSTGVQTPL